ncbi:MAG: Ig-like domain-containing protein [Candidatus Azobacteroides sp.]|nr:Ig-like domain-containing protein [Candidatus Azobacteroides sp.]
MTKKIVIFLSLIMLYSVSNATRNISEEDFKNLVDYVNCYYTKRYFDKKTADKSDTAMSSTLREDYKTRIKPQLSNLNLKNAADNVLLLQDLKEYPKGELLINFIESKKEKFDPNWNTIEIIDKLVALPTEPVDFQSYFSKVTKALKEDLNNQDIFQEKKIEQISLNKTLLSLKVGKTSKLSIKIDPSDAEIKNKKIDWKVIEGNNKVSIVKKSDNGKDIEIKASDAGKCTIEARIDGKTDRCQITVEEASSLRWMYWLLFVAFIAGLFIVFKRHYRRILRGMIIIYRRTKKAFSSSYRQRDLKIKEPVTPSFDNTDLEKWQRSIEKNITDLSNRITTLQSQSFVLNENDKTEIIDAIVKITRLDLQELREDLKQQIKNNKKDTSIVEPVKTNIVNQTAEVNTLYADAIDITEGTFYNIRQQPADETIYELKLRDTSTALFAIYKGAYRRVIDRPSNLAGCEKQIFPRGQHLEVEEGIAQQQVDGKWKVIQKAKIKIV